MMSALIKTYYAKKKGIDPKKIYVVAVMPCVAKKYEAHRPEHFIELELGAGSREQGAESRENRPHPSPLYPSPGEGRWSSSPTPC